MALSVKSPEADRLARELAAVTGESITEAVTVALRQRLERERRERRIGDRLRRFVEEVAAYPVIDDRSMDEILGYDGAGLPG